MKVKFVDFEEAVMAFASKLIGTMPTTAHKFMSGIALAHFAGRLEKSLGVLADADGMVDTDGLRKMADSGFAASGDSVSFSLGEESTSMFFKPITVTISKADVIAAIGALDTKYGR